jgi:hypothetical protein
MVKLLVRLPEDLHADFKSLVAQKRSSIQEYAQAWIAREVQKGRTAGLLPRKRRA